MSPREHEIEIIGYNQKAVTKSHLCANKLQENQAHKKLILYSKFALDRQHVMNSQEVQSLHRDLTSMASAPRPPVCQRMDPFSLPNQLRKVTAITRWTSFPLMIDATK